MSAAESPAHMTATTSLAQTIDAAFERRDEVGTATKGAVRDAVDEALLLLDRGAVRVAEKVADGSWRVNQWLKKAVLLSFRLNDMGVIPGGPGRACGGTRSRRNSTAGTTELPCRRVSCGAGLCRAALRLYRSRRGADAVIRQSRRLCRPRHHDRHLGDGRLLRADREELPHFRRRGIGGVLEPLQAGPVIVEDNCFVGARSEVAEGVIVREGAVLSMGVFIGASTKIVDRDSGAIFMGEVPSYAVVVPGSLPGKPRRAAKQAPALLAP